MRVHCRKSQHARTHIMHKETNYLVTSVYYPDYFRFHIVNDFRHHLQEHEEFIMDLPRLQWNLKIQTCLGAVKSVLNREVSTFSAVKYYSIYIAMGQKNVLNIHFRESTLGGGGGGSHYIHVLNNTLVREGEWD